MKTLKAQIATLALVLVLTMSLFNCSDDESNNNPMIDNSSLVIQARATFDGTNTTSRNTVNTDLNLTTFKLNIEELELEFDDIDDDNDDDYEGYDDDGYFNSDDDVELQGPFELDLLNGTSNIVTLDLPQGAYESLEFEFDENENPNSDLFNKTILIEGTIDGTPFEFWYDFEEELEIDYENSAQNISISNGINTIIINFDLDNLFNTSSGIDLSEATDNDGDGIIEINPNDNDGNNDLADDIKDKISDIIDLLDD